MTQSLHAFPPGFLWGTATAAQQVEGNNTNNAWSVWEQQPGRILNGHKAGLACDWWGGRWQEDLDRAAATGQNAHRLSVEWSRIQPAPDKWDEAALEKYRIILQGAHQRGLQPMVTLHHFSNPIWLEERGGWENPETAKWFAEFVRRTVTALKGECSLWCTINEPNVYSTCAFLDGTFPPGKQDLLTTLEVMTQLVRGHAAAYRTIHEVQPEARVGMSVYYRSMHPASWLARFPTFVQSHIFNKIFPLATTTGKVDLLYKMVRVPEAAHTLDFFGVQYYSRDYIHFDISKPGDAFGRREYRPGVELSGGGYIANEPDGMLEALEWGSRCGVPLIVTENGTEDAEDRTRPKYLVQHVDKVWQAIRQGLDVRGYFHWSLVDNFEWERGWSQRFGLWGLDPETQARIRRPSVDVYESICKANGLPVELLEKYS
jgi:beta-glucosidase